MEWIAFTIFAALMQSVRTAGQKHMTNTMSALVASWARYGFGLPLAIVYLVFVVVVKGNGLPPLSIDFLWMITLAGIAQLAATILLVKVLSQRNFAAGTTYAKTEGLLAAMLAWLLFDIQLNGMAWFAIAIGVLGIIFVSIQKAHLSTKGLLASKSALMGIAAGFCFAITSVFIREANQALQTGPVVAGAYSLTWSLFIQGIICTALVHRQNVDNWRQVRESSKVGWFVGITGTLGSIGWYTAFAFQEAAIVKTLGNVEFIFTVALTFLFFKERITKYEWIGMLSVLVSVVILLQSGTY
jgi:drug/metabolite transporter (DMT)-like permease